MAKVDPIKKLIERYKKKIKQTKLQDEVYKWKLVDDFKGRPDTSVVDFAQEIKDVKFQNLVYAMTMAVNRHITKERPEEYRALFIQLFDEQRPLKERISDFRKDSLTLYRELEGKQSHHQDERAIATYLTFQYPNKYTFYKSTFYKNYSELIGVEPKKTGAKYLHYLDLIEELIQNYIEPDKELIGLVKSCLPEYYDGQNHLLLAQDILYQMLEKEQDATVISLKEDFIAWLIKNPKHDYYANDVNKLSKALDSYQDFFEVDIYKCDASNYLEITKIILSELYDNSESEFLKFSEKIQTHLPRAVLGKRNYLRYLKEKFEKKSSDKDADIHYWLFAPGENASKWEEFYNEGFMGLGWSELGDLKQYKSRKAIKDALVQAYGGEGSKKNDVSANDDFVNKIKVGDIIISKKGRGELLGYGEVTSDYYFDEERSDFNSCRDVDWKLKGNWDVDFSLVLKTLTDITKYETDHLDFEKFHERLFDIMGINNTPTKLYDMDSPLNTILYGPPGTGKTYKLQNEYFDRFTTKTSSVGKDEYFINKINDYKWWEVIGAAVLDIGKAKVSDILGHPLVKFKTSLSEAKNVRASLWGTLQSHTIEECELVNYKGRQSPYLFNKLPDSVWEFVEDGKNEAPQIVELLDEFKNFEPTSDKVVKRYKFVTFHQSFSYEEFIEGIKPEMEIEGSKELSYEIKNGLFKEMCETAQKDPNNPYAIFIDEINRGNVSAIFGELITLIEDDKRLGADNEMTLTLPYTGKSFGVPKNLYIIGTMNTADRSVEALDTALRRRFSFVEMMPEPEKLSKDFHGVNLQKLLETINNRVELLVDRDHTIGHSYFINLKSLDDLAVAFNDKIVPLLQEYFYGDYGKIGLVLGEGFVEVKDNKDKKFSGFKYDGKGDFITPTFKLRKVDSTTVLAAIGTLLETAIKKTSTVTTTDSE